jgi:hypothetical protein
MNEPQNKKSMAGGVFILIGLLGGVIIGAVYNQPSAGMVIGMGIGIATATLIWLIDSKRGN